MYQIHADLARRALTACALPEYDAKGNPTPLPEYIETRLLRRLRVLHRLGAEFVSDGELAEIVCDTPFATYNPTRDPGQSIADKFRTGKLKSGAPIEVFWRGDWCEATITGTQEYGKVITCLIGDDPDERAIVVDHVRLPAKKQKATA